VDSDLPGVYQVTRYASTTDGGCDEELADVVLIADYLVLYGFQRDPNSDEVRLGGAFCTDVSDCRQVANNAGEPGIGYSFIEGSDETGWRGWAVPRTGGANDQCEADVQAHTLTSTDAQSISIETKTLETVFPPTVDGNDATCSVADAIASLNDDTPCTQLMLVEATREANL
jgi:hypothetical protein